MDYHNKDMIMKARLCLLSNPSTCLSTHDFLSSAFGRQIEKEVSMVKFEVYLSYTLRTLVPHAIPKIEWNAT